MKQHIHRLGRAIRLGYVTLHILSGVAEVVWRFPRLSLPQRMHRIHRWSCRLTALFGIEVRVIGAPPHLHPPRTLLVANHISWMDIFVLNNVTVARFVSKSEVRQWPLIGVLCSHAGTLFIERDKKRDAARINLAMAQALAQGECLAFFPEGSTTDGSIVKPFNSSLFQPAVEAGASVLPCTLRYLTREGSPSAAAAYIDDMSLLASIRTILRARGLVAEVRLHPTLDGSTLDRRALAQASQTAVASGLGYPMPASPCATAAAADAPAAEPQTR